MFQVAKGVWQLSGFLPRMINAFLVEDVMIDALTRWAKPRVARQLEGRKLSLVALTHCHPDHQGLARFVCETFGVPLACHEADVDFMEGRRPMLPDNAVVRLFDKLWSGPPYPVGRVLHDGDEVAGFQVVHTPGHTPGHVIYFRHSDRLAIVGDLLHNMNGLTGAPGLHETPRIFSVDPEQNRASLRILLQLRPALVCFGHGPPLHRVDLLERFIERQTAPRHRAIRYWRGQYPTLPRIEDRRVKIDNWPATTRVNSSPTAR
jgi:hydroxyacylglutathione hydrolase